MNKELCFKLNDDELYLDQILVNYNGIPIFFICKGSKGYYLVLCTDYENYNYIIVLIYINDIYNLLHNVITLRAIMLKQNQYWEVLSGDKIDEDTVTLKSMNEIDFSCLPKDEFYYALKH